MNPRRLACDLASGAVLHHPEATSIQGLRFTTVSLIPAAEAMARFFLDDGDLCDCFRAFLKEDEAAFLMLSEGDLAIDIEGLVQTERLVPELIETMGG